MNDFDTVNMNKAQKTVYYLREYGFHYTMRRAMKKLGFKVDEDSEYMTWVRKQQCSTKELELQSKEKFPFMPKVTVYVEGCGEQAADAGFTKAAFKKQSYRVAKVKVALEQMSLDHLLNEDDADVFVFAAAGTKPRNQYIYDCVKAMNEDVKLLYAGEGKEDTFRPLLVYTDEDRVTPDGKRYVKPYFKPDMSLELLCNFQYVGGMFTVRRELLEQFRNTDVEVFGNGWYDLLFYCFEHTEKIAHIQEVLFSRRGADTTRFGRSEDRGQKRYIERHLKRIGVDAVVENSEVPGFYHVKYQIKGNPLLSIIIPNKDHIDILDQCIQSLLHHNNYQNFEIIIAENNSTEPETFEYYEKIKKVDNRINIVYWKKEFNYSAINNFAAEFAAGELRCF
ncbi:MAG: glycosyltransferase [Lachnospiraceae bacterium]